MPQIVPRSQLGLCNFGAGVLTKFPEAAAYIGRIAAHEADISMYTAELLAAMLGPSRAAGLTMYKALAGATQRRATLTAVAEAVLDKRDLSEFTSIEKKQKATRGMRNDVVHGIWGYSWEYPERLLRVDSGQILSGYARIGYHPLQGDGRALLKFWHWTERDFQAVESAASEVRTRLLNFAEKIQNKYPQTADAALLAAVALANRRET